MPIPWFPRNPIPQDRIAFLGGQNADRKEVIERLGQPWANLDDSVYVYLASRDSAHIIAYGGGEATINRDYFLVIDFDETGRVASHEIYADSLRHNHCFKNGVCLKGKTYNIPLAPEFLDLEAKQFRSSRDVCTVYIFRDREGQGLRGEGYVDIWFHPTDQRMTRLATSVEYGYSRFEFPSAEQHRFSVDQAKPIDVHGPLDNNPSAEGKQRVFATSSCPAGSLVFFRIFLPEKNSRPIEFHRVAPELGREKVLDARLLLERQTIADLHIAAPPPLPDH